MRTGVHIRKAEVGETEAQRDALPWRLLVRAVAVVVFIALLAVLLVSWMGSRSSDHGVLRAANAVVSQNSMDVSSSHAAACAGIVCSDKADPAAAAAPTTAPPTTAAPTTTAPATAAPQSVGSTVLPGGSPPPVLIVFDGDAITVSGAVRSAGAASRLSTLAEAYSKTPNARIVNNLVVDPHTPDTVGVRVIEMNAERFPTGVSTVSPDYALGLTRSSR